MSIRDHKSEIITGTLITAGAIYAKKQLDKSGQTTYRAYEDQWLESLKHANTVKTETYNLGRFDVANNINPRQNDIFSTPHKAKVTLAENRRRYHVLQKSILDETPNLVASIKRAGEKNIGKGWAKTKVPLLEDGGFNSNATVSDWLKKIDAIDTNIKIGTPDALNAALVDMDRLASSSTHITQEKTLANDLFTLVLHTYQKAHIPVAKTMQELNAAHAIAEARLNILQTIETASTDFSKTNDLMNSLRKKLIHNRIGKTVTAVVGFTAAVYTAVKVLFKS